MCNGSGPHGDRRLAATPDLNDIYRDIRALGLETNLGELEAFGFTVIEGALDVDTTDALRGKIREIAETRPGRRLDLENEAEHQEIALIPYLLFKDPIFKKAVLNEKQLALITYLLGKHCIHSSLTCHLKGEGGQGLLLHSDTANGIPEPFSPYSHVANTNYALTDYTEENGCLAMVPGSHRMHRQPTKSRHILLSRVCPDPGGLSVQRARGLPPARRRASGAPARR